LRELAAHCPDSAVLQMAWGLSLIARTAKLGERDAARQGIALLQKSVQMAPEDPYVLDIVGQACLSMDAFPAALPLLEELNRLYPGNPAALCNLARAHIGLRQFGRARSALEEALRIEPQHSAARALLKQLETLERGETPPDP
jgi:Flp pilus assembly protein TadD